MFHELAVLIAFACIQCLFAWLHHVNETKLTHRLTHLPVVAILASPTMIHTIQDYAIHIVIYSGKILGH